MVGLCQRHNSATSPPREGDPVGTQVVDAHFNQTSSHYPSAGNVILIKSGHGDSRVGENNKTGGMTFLSATADFGWICTEMYKTHLFQNCF